MQYIWLRFKYVSFNILNAILSIPILKFTQKFDSDEK